MKLFHENFKKYYVYRKKHLKWSCHSFIDSSIMKNSRSIAVFVLNPTDFRGRITDSTREVLINKGIASLERLYLFSRIGKFSKLLKMTDNMRIHKRCNELIGEIIPEVNKVFFAYGDVKSEKEQELVNKRVKDVKHRMLNINPNMKFYRFGELTYQGNPKALNKVRDNDVEVLCD